MGPRGILPLTATLCLAIMTNSSASDEQPRVRPSLCALESAKLSGTKTVRVEGKIHPPRRIRHVPPSYPKLPPITVGSGYWIGEARVDTLGKVSQVWVVREPKLTPPYPPFGEAIVDAIRQWEFEPLALKGIPTPFCLTVTVILHWE
jgi:hypothetical protein